MIRNTYQRTVHSICRRMPSIDLQPELQRESVWSKSQKQLLIDSILNDLDIPKIYINEKKTEDTKEEVVDGQQRLTAINEFLNDAYPLKWDTPDIDVLTNRGKLAIRELAELNEGAVILLILSLNSRIRDLEEALSHHNHNSIIH